MTTPNVNPSPKQRFVAIKHCVDQHRELIASPVFQLAIETALTQMMWVQSGGGDSTMHIDGNTAASRFYRLQGAEELIRTMKTLAESAVPLPPQDTGDISHTFK